MILITEILIKKSLFQEKVHYSGLISVKISELVLDKKEKKTYTHSHCLKKSLVVTKKRRRIVFET